MKKIRQWWNKLKGNRKLRCGAFSVLLSGMAVSICVLLVFVCDRIEKKHALTGDYSFNAATVQGEVSQEVLYALEKDVHIYAVVPQQGENATLMKLLERYDAASEHITCSRESILKNPALLERFSDVIGDNKVSDDCLIVYCRETGRARVLDEDDYYVYSYDLQTGAFSEAGFTYEKSLTEAILYVSGDEMPTLQVLTGHGELTKADTAAMEQLLVSANYQVQWVSLNQNTLDAESPLMILSPYFDFSEQELNQLTAFAMAGGDFLIATQYSDPVNMENFNALLRMYGVESLPGLVVAEEEDKDSYYADTPVWLMPYMLETAATLPLIENAMDILLFPGARAFEMLDDLPNTLVQPVLETGKAYISSGYLNGLDDISMQPGDREGYFPVAVWTDKMFDDGTLSHALVLGNVDVLTDSWLHNNTHASAFLMQMIQSLQGKEAVQLDIVPRNAIREGLGLGNITPAIVAAVLLPLLILIGALLVLVPRKSR